jgi:hypothetical protein
VGPVPKRARHRRGALRLRLGTRAARRGGKTLLSQAAEHAAAADLAIGTPASRDFPKIAQLHI